MNLELNFKEPNIKIEEDKKEEVKKNYNNKKNYDNFYKKNIVRIKEKNVCNVCYGSYTYFNKSVHNKTKRHLKMLELKNNV